MVLMYLPIDFHHSSIAYLLLLVATPVFLYVSSPIFSAAWRALKNRNLNMDVMYAMGSVSPLRRACSEPFASSSPGVHVLRQRYSGSLPSFPWGVPRSKAKGRTGAAIKRLMGLQPGPRSWSPNRANRKYPFRMSR